jgi:signal peptidase I
MGGGDPKHIEAAEAGDKKSRAERMELYDWLQCLVTAVICAILIFVFIGRMTDIIGSSMLKTLQDKDNVVISNMFYTPKYGDIVIIKTDAFEDSLVKRVIATAGQTIDIDFTTGAVSIDGKVIQENYINTPTNAPEDFAGPLTVPPGYVFVMGDNRNESLDSRSKAVWLVDTRQILGKVLFVLIPGRNEDGTRSWGRFGSVYG